MRRAGLYLGLVLSLALAGTACGGDADERAGLETVKPGATADGDQVTVTGCLTAGRERESFVVTAARDALTSGAIYSGDGGTPTYTYELVGNAADLSQHVGKQVEIAGILDEDRKDSVDVDDHSEAELPPVQSGDRKVEPAIETETEIEINVRRLHVSTVTPTGQACLPASQ